MNILPLVVALMLILAILTVEKLDKFKNQTAIQEQYQHFIKTSERVAFNDRQQKLFDQYQKDIKQVSFRFFVDPELRKSDEKVTKQYRLINIELMKILYQEAPFFQKLKERRGDPDVFLGQLLDAIQKAADEAPPKLIRRIEDIARLDLKDDELQEAFYHILKGTISRKELLKFDKIKPPKEAYLSLFNFINDEGSKGHKPKIEIRHSPREILMALFGNEEVANNLIIKRKEMGKKGGDPAAFANEFKGKLRPGIEDQIIDFTIKDKTSSEYD